MLPLMFMDCVVMPGSDLLKSVLCALLCSFFTLDFSQADVARDQPILLGRRVKESLVRRSIPL